jgi:hypothetical protein
MQIDLLRKMPFSLLAPVHPFLCVFVVIPLRFLGERPGRPAMG